MKLCLSCPDNMTDPSTFSNLLVTAINEPDNRFFVKHLQVLVIDLHKNLAEETPKLSWAFDLAGDFWKLNMAIEKLSCALNSDICLQGAIHDGQLSMMNWLFKEGLLNMT